MPVPKQPDNNIDRRIEELRLQVIELEKQIEVLEQAKSILKGVPNFVGTSKYDLPNKGISNILYNYIKNAPSPVTTGQIVDFYAKQTGETDEQVRDNVYSTLLRLTESVKIIKERKENMRGAFYRAK